MLIISITIKLSVITKAIISIIVATTEMVVKVIAIAIIVIIERAITKAPTIVFPGLNPNLLCEGTMLEGDQLRQLHHSIP